jgi:hypothetical protein
MYNCGGGKRGERVMGVGVRVINPVYHGQEYKRPLIAFPSCAHWVHARASSGGEFLGMSSLGFHHILKEKLLSGAFLQ